ncbi:gluconate 2-dehydrogenase subunit 3 family protein [Flexithrix dorotheae]|uniref:gluconate 2-dehydrogenase subunit 3 family protein n=1 Tax=Flexithrix dorotheae TaxID=70993 RepID=UPI0003742831|nr:gluconate 2-dehydrogenase subunit 3 family protein [Flexithrix dorotheae]
MKNKINRRDTLKAIGLASLGATTSVIPGCNTPEEKKAPAEHDHAHNHGGGESNISEEDMALMKQQFFNEHEMKTIKVLGDLVIPADEKSGSASDAGFPEFLEFMMKDQPQHQVGMRGGLNWLDNQCQKEFGKKFIDCTENEQKSMLDEIAYPEKARPENSQGVAWFNKFRDFVATGFFTSKLGIDDLQYMGNVATVWQGAPQEVLDKLGVSYDPGTEYAN